ncbi:MAG TPA: PAS domain-containing protein [Thermoanaerobaculia bacterium]|jgi:two-component system sensor histidine kinase UhpB|nr:PAS domain-containing protein [Thermoanaerobaculia bacterium]
MPPANGEAIAARYLFVGADRPIAFVDRAFEVLWGVRERRLRDEPWLWLERIHPDDRGEVAAALASPSGSSWVLEYRVCREDGTVVWVQDRGRVLTVRKWRQTSGLVVDVTLQRLLEERLRLHGQLLDAVGEAVIASDPAGIVTSWNPAAERLFGRSAAEAVGSPLLQLAFAPAIARQVADVLDRLFLDGRRWTGELRLRRRDGREMPGHVTLAPLLGGDGEVTGVVALVVDLSELRAAQRRAEKSEQDQSRLVEQLRRLTAHLQVVREQEQRRISRDVHDELGQMLTGLKLDVGSLRRRAAAGNGQLGGDQLRERLAGIAELVEQTLGAMRHIARQLRPPALDDLGLETAIEWLVDDFRSRTSIACELRCDLAGMAVPGAQDTAAYRIVQEALTNVARHAEASCAAVRVSLHDHVLTIDVVDDGKGVPREALRAPQSLGILGMRERARARGGELSVRRRSRGGTRVHARLPVEQPPEAAEVLDEPSAKSSDSEGPS